MPISLVVVADHPGSRARICTLLQDEPDFRVVGEAASDRQAIVLAREVLPDVIVMDLAMPRLKSVEITRKVVQLCPYSQVIALSVYSDRKHIEALRVAGASASLLKHTVAEEIVPAIREVHYGKLYTNPAFTA